jgi:hypothetical protein
MTPLLFVMALSLFEDLIPSDCHLKQKADVVKHPQVFDHVGFLRNEPPGSAGLLFIKSSDDNL